MTSKPTRRPFRLEGLAFGEWRLQSTFATREAAVNWLRDRPTRIIDTRTGQDVTVESEPTDDAEARALAAEVAARGYRERAEKAEALIEDMVPKTWDGLLALLDEVYPDDVFPTLPDDPARDAGPRAVSLIRYARRVEAERDALRAERDALAARIERVRALHVRTTISVLPCECPGETHEAHVPPDDCTTDLAVCAACYELGEAVYPYAYEDGGIQHVEYPCPTVRALDGDGGE